MNGLTERLARLIAEQPWRRHARCTDRPELFFDPALEPQAKALCRVCPSRLDCLAHAMDTNEPFGTWGGKNPDERERIRQERDELARRRNRTRNTTPTTPSGPGDHHPSSHQ